MPKLRKQATTTSLLYVSVGSIIGSGWLFGALFAAKQAGPLSIYSWILGGVIIMTIALVYSELSTLFPKSGALVHISHIGHGVLLGRIWSFLLFLAYVAIAPIEVMAVLGYANNYCPYFMDPELHVLTHIGVLTAMAVLAVMVVFNFFSIRWVLYINSTITFWKILIPFITLIVLMAFSFHPTNLQVNPEHFSVVNIFTATVSAGVIFSYLGFRTAIELAGETQNPSRSLPIAVIGSVLIGMILYVGLQLGFILALPPSALHSGWSHLHYIGSAGPLAALVVLIGATWWAPVLYLDAFVSPLGTGYIYMASTARVVMAAGETSSAPRCVSLLNRHGIPWVGLLLTFVVGACFFFPFPSWQKMVNYVSSIMTLSYSIGPILLLQLRKYLPDMPRPFRLRGAWLLAPLAFFVSNSIIFWSGYKTVTFIFLLLLAFFVIYVLWAYFIKKVATETFGWPFIWWLCPYFLGLWLFSRFGPVSLGGSGAMSFGYSMLGLFLFSLLILAFAIKSGVPKDELVGRAQYMASLQSYADGVVKE